MKQRNETPRGADFNHSTFGLLSDNSSDEGQEVIADIDCGGKQDVAKLVYDASNVILLVTPGETGLEQSLLFGLGGVTEQNSLCGATAYLAKEIPPQESDEVFVYGLGAIPEGRINKEGCFDLNLSGGECDSIHIYWNHKKNQLNWWRL